MNGIVSLGKSSAATINRRLAALKRRRKLWLEVHFWLGLFAGALLVIIGLTGSLLVYFKEIDGWLNPELLVVAAPKEGRAAYKPLTEIVAAARSATPPDAKIGFAYYPRNDQTAFWFYTAYQRDSDVLNVFVNPYTAQVTGKRVWYSADSPFKNCLMGFLFKLHYALLLGETGNTLVGILCVFFIVSTLSGLILWWPITGKWRQAFLFKRRASTERFNHDLHKISGFYSLLVLLGVLISGVYFNLGTQFVWMVERFSTVTRLGAIHNATLPNGSPISPDKAIAIAQQRYPDSSVFAFSLPEKPDQPYAVNQLEPLAGGFVGRRTIKLDQYSGEVLHVGDPLRSSGGDVFIQWQWPLHSGYFFGMTGRILVFICGLLCPIIFVTGVIRWLQKRRARRISKERRAQLEAEASA